MYGYHYRYDAWTKKLKDAGLEVTDVTYEIKIHPVPSWQCEPRKDPYESLFKRDDT